VEHVSQAATNPPMVLQRSQEGFHVNSPLLLLLLLLLLLSSACSSSHVSVAHPYPLCSGWHAPPMRSLAASKNARLEEEEAEE